MSILISLIRLIVDAGIFLLLLRFLLQKLGASHSNVIVTWIIRWTEPVFKPLRAYLPTIAGFDSAIFLVMLLAELVKTMLILSMQLHVVPGVVGALLIALAQLGRKTVDVYFWSLIIAVVMMWLPALQHSSFSRVVDVIAQPLLQFARRFIPPIAGIDWSAIPILLLLKGVDILILRAVILYGLHLAY